MPGVEARALHLVGQIYDAALDADKWPHLIETIASAVKAHGAMLRRVHAATGQADFFQTLGYDDEYVRAYREHFARLDPYQDFFASCTPGTLGDPMQMIDQLTHRRSEYFNDYERPQDKLHVLGSTLARDGDATIQTGFHRGRHAGPFDDEDRQLLQLIFPHIARAVQLQSRLADGAGRQALVSAALDHLRVGVILADAAAKPVYLNREADAHLSSGDGIVLHADGLGLFLPGETARLRTLIAAAARTTAGEGLASGGEMRLKARSQNAGPLHIWVAPLSRQRLAADISAPAACAAVFVSRQGSVALPWQRVSVSYGLTPAEARLAVLLADGVGMQDAADRLNVSISTVRSQVKAVFAKTGARRQSELVAMLLQGVLAICRMDDGRVAQ